MADLLFHDLKYRSPVVTEHVDLALWIESEGADARNRFIAGS